MKGVETDNIMENPPLVSVCVQTFQHNDFISQCLESIVSQKTNFRFEIILGDDESDDGTSEICKKYAEQYPEKVKLFLRKRKDVIYINGKPTGRYNFLQNINESSGKYIALCEGDDYWTDPLKLQKQFDLLESNLNYGICFNKVQELNTFNNSLNKLIPEINENTIFEIKDYILSNKTATCSIFFRKNLFLPVPDWFYKLPFGDLGLVLIIMERSNDKGIVLNDTMGVYRVHGRGIHGSMKENSKLLVKAYYQHIDFFNIIKNEFLIEEKYYNILREKIIELYTTIRNHYIEDHMWFKSFTTTICIYVLKLFLKLKLK